MTRVFTDALRILCLVVMLAMVVYFLTYGRETLNGFLNLLRELGAVPFFAVFALTISFGVPPSPFLLIAGAAFSPVTNLVGFTLSYAFSLSISFLWVGQLFKKQLDGLLTSKFPFLARFVDDNIALATLMVRLTPGFPYVLQNCLLVAVCRSFFLFLTVSLPPLIFMSMLMSLLAKNALSGKYLTLLPLLALLAVMILLFKRMSRRYTTK